MNGKRKGRVPLKLNPLVVLTKVVRAHVTTYCGDFDWAESALGHLRAKDFTRLLMLAESVESDILTSNPPGERHRTEYDASRFARAFQFVALVAKFQFSEKEIPNLDPTAAALRNFRKAERRNRRLNMVFAAHRNRGSERHWSVPLVRAVFLRVLGKTPHYGEILRKCDFSGGASVSHHGQDTHLATKLNGVLSGGARAFDYLVEAMWKNADYREFFCLRNGHYYCADFEYFRAKVESQYKDVRYNKITVVPKKARSGRTIAMEPEACNYLQKGIDLEIRALLVRHLNLDLSMQSVNQDMAYEGATDLTVDPYVTLDVKDASNGVLRESIRSVSPPRWFELMDHTRSHAYLVEGESQDTPYEMFCSMGNGFCFPLETLLFSAIVIAAHKHVNAPIDFRCYGDDIICRRSVALVVVECLRAFGFRLNMDKSFVFGPFRESCGANWYGGRDVTPGYMRDRITTVSGLHSLHNNLSSWPKVQEALRSFVPLKERLYVADEWVNRENISDQAFIVTSDVAMTGFSVRFDASVNAWTYRLLQSQAVPDENWEQRYSAGRHTCDSTVWRESMIRTAVYRGSSAAGPFHLRRQTRTRIVRSHPAQPRNIEALLGMSTEQQLDHYTGQVLEPILVPAPA